MHELERMGNEKLETKDPQRKVRRVKKSSKVNKEKADRERDLKELCKFIEEHDFENNKVEPQDFEGNFKRDMNLALRKRIRRVKISETDPIILGRILAKTGNRRVPFVADTGCSVNILPARWFAAISGLKWQDVDKDESTFMSATNHELTIVGQTTTFVKLDSIKHPVKIQFLVCSDDGDEGLLSLDTLKELSIVPRDFPLPMDRAMRETKLNRVKEAEMDEQEEYNLERLMLVEMV